MNIDIDAYVDNAITIGAHWQGKTWRMAHTIVLPLLKVANVWIWDYQGRFIQYLRPDVRLIKRTVEALEYGVQFLKPQDKSRENFDRFCKKVAGLSNLVVVIDEAHNYSTAQTMSAPHAELVRNLPGNQGISYIEIFQRPVSVHKDILNNALHRFCFAFDVPTDIKYLRQWLGVEVELFLSYDQRSKFAKIKFGDKAMLTPHSYVYRNMHRLSAEVFEFHGRCDCHGQV